MTSLQVKMKTAGNVPAVALSFSVSSSLCPAVRSRLGSALVVAIAAVDRLPTHGRERNLGCNTAAVACHTDHGSLAAATVSVAGHFSLIAAVLASFRLVRKSAFSVERLLILAENELPSAIGAIEGFV
jgi:hypothetical protein